MDGSQNPFRYLVFPLCSSYPALLHAVIAVSANDRRNLSGIIDTSTCDQAVITHKLKALEYVRQAVSTVPRHRSSISGAPHDPSHIVKHEGNSLLLTITLLCYLEIATGSRHEWATHLHGASSLIRYYHGLQRKEEILESKTLKFVYEYLSLRDTLFTTTLDEQSYTKHDIWATSISTLYPQLRTDRSDKINPNNGLSAELLDIISSTTAFAREKYRIRRCGRSSSEQELNFIEHADSLKIRLETLQQWSEETSHEHLLFLNAEAFQQAAWIYLYYAAYDDSCGASSIQETRLPKLLDLLTQVHAKQGSLLGSIPYPMWALFIAACVVQEHDRARILRMFQDLKDRRPFSNVPRTMSAIEAIWKRKDLNVGHDGATTSLRYSRLHFEWEDALLRLGWKMALT